MLIRRRYKHLKRYRQVANILARHGFGYLLDRLNLTDILPYHQRLKQDSDEHKDAEKTRGERLRQALTELGTTFIKFGQILSTRSDLLPKDIIIELQKLQDRIPPISFERVREQVEGELGAPLEEIFECFHEEPIAGASIGQVHRACLKDGKECVVKVRRPEVEAVVQVDLEILFDLARLAESRSALSRHYHLVEIVEEFAWGLKRELDYSVEGRNAERLWNNFAQDEDIKVPKVYWDYSSTQVLTLEYVEGTKLSNLQELDNKGYDKRIIAEKLSRAVLKQVLLDGFFHADPHPGNIFVQKGNKICFMDFGLMGYLSEERKKQVIKLVLALVRKDSNKIVKAILEMGVVSKTTDIDKLKRDMDMLISLYYTVPLSKINIGEVIGEVLELAFAHRVKIPTEMTLMAKTLIVLEGVLKDLEPTISIIEIAEPFAAKLIAHKYDPRNLTRELSNSFQEYFELVSGMPQKADRLLDKALGDDMSFKLQIQNLNVIFAYLDKIANKLSFSIVLLSFSLVMAGLIIASSIGRGGSDFFWQIPVLEIAFVSSFILFTWLIVSIIRSGRF
ncbi:2-polyprenylphenol 6-hydroxylase [Desulfitibacter alkalitolerans]|uniref:2-polyprenylphenol 6-hydroxylase n=1 Tax=Desulfitibacter alkalitolerans TaxID=264641 RepID=UPI000688CD96|nr:2-polyprenylphenol 6-hydroxylase [Desulfitibacter alkalitolerans]